MIRRYARKPSRSRRLRESNDTAYKEAYSYEVCLEYINAGIEGEEYDDEFIPLDQYNRYSREYKRFESIANDRFSFLLNRAIQNNAIIDVLTDSKFELTEYGSALISCIVTSDLPKSELDASLEYAGYTCKSIVDIVADRFILSDSTVGYLVSDKFDTYILN